MQGSPINDPTAQPAGGAAGPQSGTSRPAGSLFPGAPAAEVPAREAELWRGRTNWKHFIGRLLLWLAGVTAAAVLVIWVARATEPLGPRGAGWIIGVVVLASGVLVPGRVLLRILGTRYRLTTQRLFIERGILNQTVDQTELIRVDDVRLYKPLLNRVFGLGSVAVVSTDATDREVLITGIADPDRVAEAIRGQMRALRRQSVFVENI